MRVTDLLALLADQNKNASVLLDTKPTPSRFDDFKLTTVNDQPQLVFQPNPERKAALRVWELQLLLNQPDLQQRFVYQLMLMNRVRYLDLLNGKLACCSIDYAGCLVAANRLATLSK